MKNSNKKYKFYLFPHIYYAKSKSNLFLLYNTKTGLCIESESSVCLEVIERMYVPANLGIAELNNNEIQEKSLSSFIKRVIEYEFGNLIEQNELGSDTMFVNFIPILNLQKDIERLKVEGKFTIGEDLLTYINELNIYVNNSCELECPNCDIYYKQTKSCYKTTSINNLSIDLIRALFENLKYSLLKKINIMGGDISKYNDLKRLLQLIDEYKFDFEFHIWAHYQNFSKNEFFLSDNTNLINDIIVSFPIEKEFEDFLINNETNNIFHFLIENESQYREIEKRFSHLNQYDIVPIYTGNNKLFFQEYICMEKEDILANIISFRTIFCNQKLNSNNFGKLYLFPDGTVKSNMNTDAIGNLNSITLLEIIYNELDKNTAWRKIRDNEPCNNCVFQYLCPPPSNYEFVMNKNNLCNLKTIF
ncbi:pseudo-rSAM protein [Dysgonomonas sp. PFB1-18]|uniref:TIGR04150 pseudo-rSAM protein n=1 Tax=unclassified Dysgonomonas TaxID=2630389 RepID=UPI002474FB1E|nr:MULTISPECIES: TIGR04150 pseudo-rSAM protein [unclassified Dysgonomonas]MDL2303344.1 TIGR04150 pseudo-rSAM protein [Dysgonomonas sp. OttesenSCG-928-D17]MDH6310611.1 pseudo-rSAM protein [Dysgonomonas sp. PF1-14]MDH6340462.1 pseudo-rSAM protein [Dysgonomonas sp. PF1-16]MDH6382130.1 pseudo-rSAM protein [Dysgonomonas sp. PFB1-18]MDH6399474.1 pseudo-rSAM protein [Dysgonomonas sp. PF1-23]